MAKHFDKDSMKKNGFWIALGAYVLLWFVAAIIVLWPSEIAGKTTYQTTREKMDKAKNTRPKTPKYQDPWNEHKEKFLAQKEKVWNQAWQQQASMYTWPEEMAFKPPYPDDVWEDDLNNRGRFRDQYLRQFSTLERAMLPVEMAGGLVGVMQPQGWNTEWAKGGGWNPNKAPTREEVWLAQEDYWVKREVLWIVREAVNTVAFFRDVTEEVTAKELEGKGGKKAPDKEAELPDAKEEKAKDKDAKPPQKDKDDKAKTDEKAKDKDDKAKTDEKAKDKDDKAKDKDAAKAKDKDDKKKEQEGHLKGGVKPSAENGYRRIFRNANWELDVRFEKSQGKWALDSKNSKITNVTATERTLPLANPRNNQGLGFRLYSHKNTRANYALLVQGEPVQAGQTVPIASKNLPVEPLNPQEPFGVEQLLEWEMSPVRRIEAIEVPYHSHRTANVALKVREDLKALDKDAEPPPPAEATKDGGPTGSGATVPPGRGMGGEMQGSLQPGDFTPINKLNRVRYLTVKEQSRHLPLAIRLIVDQSHVHDVLAAVTNSRLRIQITQVSVHHVRNVQRGSVGGPGMGKDQKMEDFKIPRPASSNVGGSPPGPSGMPMRMSGESYVPSNPSEYYRSGGPDQPAETTVLVQDTAKLVELTVYGIAALYEKYPPRKKTPDEAPK